MYDRINGSLINLKMTLPLTNYSNHNDEALSLVDRASLWVFENKILRNSLEKWFKINLWKEVIYLEKWEWDSLVRNWYNNIIKESEWKNILYLTSWITQLELINIIKELWVSHYWVNKIEELSNYLKYAWIYIAKNINLLQWEVQEVWEDYAVKLYSLWEKFEIQLSWWDNVRTLGVNINSLQKLHLNTNTDTIEEWLLWINVYEKRKDKFTDKKWNLDVIRFNEYKKQLFRKYFEALVREGYETENKEWPVARLQNITKDKVDYITRTPEFTFIDTLWDIWEELLMSTYWFDTLKELYKELKFNEWWLDKRWELNLKKLNKLIPFITEWERKWFSTLLEALEIWKHRNELGETKKNWDKKEIEKKEVEIIQYIKSIIRLLPASEEWYSPTAIQNDWTLNCQWYSKFATNILRKIWIDCYNWVIPKHAINIIITSNNKIFWLDINLDDINWNGIWKEILDWDIDWMSVMEVIKSLKEWKKTYQEIIIKSKWYKNMWKWLKWKERQYLWIVSPHIWLKYAIMNSEDWNTEHYTYRNSAELYYHTTIPAENTPENLSAIIKMADYYYHNSDYKRAIQWYNRLIWTNFPIEQYAKNLWLSYMYATEYRTSLHYYKIYLKERERNLEVNYEDYFTLASIYLSLWDLKNYDKYYKLQWDFMYTTRRESYLRKLKTKNLFDKLKWIIWL